MKKKIKKKSFVSTNSDTAFKVGTQYFIRTVTMYYTGLLVRITNQELVLESCSWIADTGYLSEALKGGIFSEIEPYPDGPVLISRGGIIDASEFKHKLPRERK